MDERVRQISMWFDGMGWIQFSGREDCFIPLHIRHLCWPWLQLGINSLSGPHDHHLCWPRLQLGINLSSGPHDHRFIRCTIYRPITALHPVNVGIIMTVAVCNDHAPQELVTHQVMHERGKMLLQGKHKIRDLVKEEEAGHRCRHSWPTATAKTPGLDLFSH